MEEEILLSIDCITYNHEKYIANAIESFLMQKTNFKYEILIHDDASTDKTQEIIREYQKKYPDIIKPILQKENQYSKGIRKISHKYNISRAKGKYIAICEGDDYWCDPNKLQKQVDYMEKNNDCGMTFHAYNLEVNGEIKKKIRVYNKSRISPVEDIILGGGDFVATNSIVYKKSIMENPPELYFNCIVGDYPLQILTSMSNYAYYIDEWMSVYRYLSENSWTRRMLLSRDSDEKIVKINENIVQLLNEINNYTKYKYEECISRKILLLKMDVLLLKNDLKSLRMLKVLNRDKYKKIYCDLSLKSRIRFGIPKIYNFLKSIRNKVKK